MRAGREDVLEVAHMAANLPRGGAVGEWYGGSLAVTEVVEALWEVSFILTVANSDKPKRVKPREFPEGLREVKRKREYAVSMAEKFRRKRGL